MGAASGRSARSAPRRTRSMAVTRSCSSTLAMPPDHGPALDGCANGSSAWPRVPFSGRKRSALNERGTRIDPDAAFAPSHLHQLADVLHCVGARREAVDKEAGNGAVPVLPRHATEPPRHAALAAGGTARLIVGVGPRTMGSFMKTWQLVGRSWFGMGGGRFEPTLTPNVCRMMELMKPRYGVQSNRPVVSSATLDAPPAVRSPPRSLNVTSCAGRHERRPRPSVRTAP